MGDHRASIKIEMSFHGIKDKCDMWINYYPNDCCGIDNRIVEFINRIHREGMDKWDEQMAVSRSCEFERQERALLASLKDKYEPIPNPIKPEQESG